MRSSSNILRRKRRHVPTCCSQVTTIEAEFERGRKLRLMELQTAKKVPATGERVGSTVFCASVCVTGICVSHLETPHSIRWIVHDITRARHLIGALLRA